MSHTATPNAEIEAVVETENIGEVVVTAYADADEIFGEDEEAIENNTVEENAKEYLLKEFVEVKEIIEVI